MWMWQRWVRLFEWRLREGQISEEIDLFGVGLLAGLALGLAWPRLPVWLTGGLFYLKYAYHERDESAVCERWAQDTYFHFLGRGVFPAAFAV